MKVIKVRSEKTYENKAKKVCNYYNYYLVLDNGRKVQIKASFPKNDNAVLDAISEYVR